jgi:hypothetical protein
MARILVMIDDKTVRTLTRGMLQSAQGGRRGRAV